MQNAPDKNCPTCGTPVASSLSLCPHCGHTLRTRRQGIRTRLLLLALLLLLLVGGVIRYQRYRDPAPLLASWMHPKETLTFRADGRMTENWRRSWGSGKLERRWYRAGDTIYIEGAVGYNQWLRCRWTLSPDRRNLTLVQYYDSGEILTMEYRRVAP